MHIISLVAQWLSDGANWSGDNGVPHRLAQHLGYSVAALLIAAVLALPLGVLVGHSRRGGFLVIGLGNAARALPTVGLLTLMVFLVGIGLVAPLTALTAIAVTPILVNTYQAVRQVPDDVVNAARWMGMTPAQVVFRVEVPAALPLILVGVRTAAIQVVSTATIAAYVGLGGLGRYIFDGLAVRDYQLVAAGAFLSAVTAVVVEGLFVALERVIVSDGLQQRANRTSFLGSLPRRASIATPTRSTS